MFRALRGMMRVVRHEAYVGLLLTSGNRPPVPSLVHIFVLIALVAVGYPRRSTARIPAKYRGVLPFTLSRVRD